MPHHAPDDLPLIADRLRLGIPLRGFDGREIALRDAAGTPIPPIQGAREFLDSGVRLLDSATAAEFLDATLDRARAVEVSACVQGIDPSGIAARVTAVLVSGAVRASVLARGQDISPSGVNRATLSWYERSRLHYRELESALSVEDARLYA